MQLHLNLTPPSSNDPTVHDCLVIGSGPAGISGAIYLKRKGLDVVIISAEDGGQVATTSSVENYPGFSSISGAELTQSFMKQLDSLAVPTISGRVQSIRKDDHFRVGLDSGRTLVSRTILYAAGAVRRKLGVPGEEAYAGRGVAYCSICDGPFFSGKHVIVVGGGNSAIESVIDLSKIARHVTLIHRSVLKADQVEIDRMMNLTNVTVRLATVIEEIRGDALLREVLLKNTATGETEVMLIDGVFVDVGNLPNSELVADLVELNTRKEIVVDLEGRTTMAGLYAAGDVTNEKYKQIVVAAGKGASAALAISDELNKRK